MNHGSEKYHLVKLFMKKEYSFPESDTILFVKISLVLFF